MTGQYGPPLPGRNTKVLRRVVSRIGTIVWKARAPVRSSTICMDLISSDCRLAGAALRRGAVEVKGAFFEGAHHAAHRFIEQHFDQPLQQARFEFEIDKKTDAATARNRGKGPVISQITERTLGIGDIDLLWRVERDARGKALSEHAKADDQIGDNEIGLALFDAGADAPGQELGIALISATRLKSCSGVYGSTRSSAWVGITAGPSRRRRAWRFAPPATARNHPPRDR